MTVCCDDGLDVSDLRCQLRQIDCHQIRRGRFFVIDGEPRDDVCPAIRQTTLHVNQPNFDIRLIIRVQFYLYATRLEFSKASMRPPRASTCHQRRRPPWPSVVSS
jgi:hypothetical protein